MTDFGSDLRYSLRSRIMRKKNVLGWLAVSSSLVISCSWAYWGIVENFHEGWYSASLKGNLLGTWRYLTPMLICVGTALWAIRSPIGGGILYIGIGIIFSSFVIVTWNPLEAGLGTALSWFPVTVFLIIVGGLYFFGRPKPKKLAYALAAGLPLLAESRTSHGRVLRGNGALLQCADVLGGKAAASQRGQPWVAVRWYSDQLLRMKPIQLRRVGKLSRGDVLTRIGRRSRTANSIRRRG